VKDVAASHDTLMHLFERVHFFLQRLNIYIGIPLTPEFTELLGKIMAQLLSILALSTKAMKDGRTSQFTNPIFHVFADHLPEKVLKRLVGGGSEFENALLHLDSLTKEESLMMAAKNLGVTHRVDDNVQVIKTLTEDIEGNMKVVEGVARGIDNDLKAARTETDELKRPYFRVLAVQPSKLICSQGSNLNGRSEHGSPLLTLPSITIMHGKPSMMGQQPGFSKAPHSENGKIMDLYCGSAAIVCFSSPCLL